MMSTADVVAVMLAVAIVSAALAITLDRILIQSKQYQKWREKHEEQIAECDRKAAKAQLLANTVAGQLLALGIKLPEADDEQQRS